ncbi:MAG: Phosphate acetyltransferase [Promethearchaeota archaeon]|nr:MAG: Phosphate acetyltransferase [Candidatus Lokiarchaeota archaeon]
MVKPIYLCSVRERVGKTLLSIGIIQKLKKMGKKVAYFKPIGIPKGAFSNKSDVDVGFVLNTVYDTNLPYDVISPVSVPDCYYIDLIDSNRKEEYLQNIKDAYDKYSEDVDYIIIEGAPSIKKYIRVGLDDVTIAQKLGIDKLVFIETSSSDLCIDNLFFTKKYFEYRDTKFKGVIFNKIDYDYFARIEELKEGHIKKYNIPVIGIVERSLDLMSPRVSEIMAAIGGELVNDSASEGLDHRVETYVIGAMNTQAALKYLKQIKKAAVVTGGDRTDLALAALKQDVSTIILTGFIKPDTSVITAANKKNIPLILSPSDTYTTIRNVEKVRAGIQEDEIDLALSLLEDKLDWDLLLE